jgi:uncharacterized membrane protein YidH (DUF202 family)
MNVTVLAVILFVVCVISIATSSIGIQAYNDNGSYKDSHKTNFDFLVYCLVGAILGLLMSMAMIYASRGR